jgi:hypothetical protein
MQYSSVMIEAMRRNKIGFMLDLETAIATGSFGAILAATGNVRKWPRGVYRQRTAPGPIAGIALRRALPGAGRGNRTHTLLPEPDFEGRASTLTFSDQ